MAEIEEIEKKIALRQARDEKVRKETAEIYRDAKLPLFKLIQLQTSEGGLKYPDRHKRIEETQRGTWDKIIKERKIIVGEDDFPNFWIGFLNGDYKSIDDYIKKEKLIKY